MKLKFYNWRGDVVDAPNDLPTIISNHDNGTIVWSTDGTLYQVRYALSVTVHDSRLDSARDFGECIAHWAADEGIISNH